MEKKYIIRSVKIDAVLYEQIRTEVKKKKFYTIGQFTDTAFKIQLRRLQEENKNPTWDIPFS